LSADEAHHKRGEHKWGVAVTPGTGAAMRRDRAMAVERQSR
jgi:hypothetical protein